jgi:hypothetical protein
MSTTLERRVEALESAYGDGGGCDRCVGTLVEVSDAITGEFDSASWNGEPLSEEEFHERETETRCPRCGRRVDLDGPVVEVGGLGDAPTFEAD